MDRGFDFIWWIQLAESVQTYENYIPIIWNKQLMPWLKTYLIYNDLQWEFKCRFTGI